METLSINYLAILAGAVLSMVIGALWYGRLLIQGGYQLTIFIVFGLLLQFWK